MIVLKVFWWRLRFSIQLCDESNLTFFQCWEHSELLVKEDPNVINECPYDVAIEEKYHEPS